MTYTIVFTHQAKDQLAALYRHIAAATSPDVATRYTDAIVTHCESLRTFPQRGMLRDDIRPGLRITNYRKRAVIAFEVEENRVAIIGVFYGGQDYEPALQSATALNIVGTCLNKIDTLPPPPPTKYQTPSPVDDRARPCH